MILINVFFKRKNINCDLFPVIVILLVLFAGLKDNYSYDYKNYLINFNEIHVLGDVFNTSYEKGYAFLVLLFKKMGLGFNTYLLFIAFISIKLKTKVIKKISIMPEISLLIYFLMFYTFNDVEQIRHGISIGLCFYSLLYILEDDKKSNIIALLLISLGILFHISAVFFIPVYILKNKELKKKSYMILLVTSLFISFINYFDILLYINDTFIHSTYLTDKLNLYNVDNSIFNISLFIRIGTITIFYFFAYDKKDSVQRLMFNTYFIGIVLTAILNTIPILAARGTTYMRYVEILMITICIKNSESHKGKKWIHYCILLVFFSYYAISFFKVLSDPTYFFYHSI